MNRLRRPGPIRAERHGKAAAVSRSSGVHKAHDLSDRFGYTWLAAWSRVQLGTQDVAGGQLAGARALLDKGLASTLWTAKRHIDPAEHAHVHEPSGLAAVALTKSGQVPLAAAVHVMADAARLAALAEAARGAGLAFRGAYIARREPALGSPAHGDPQLVCAMLALMMTPLLT